MARLNTATLVLQVADTAYRLNLVRQDPAVIKSARQARGDAAEALRSASALAVEVRGAWLRTGSSGGSDGWRVPVPTAS